jgi:hypothetical protein
MLILSVASVVVKAQNPDKPWPYGEELTNYGNQGVRFSPHIRRLLDFVNHEDDDPLQFKSDEMQCMVFEWIGGSLTDLRPSETYVNSLLAKKVAISLLHAVVVISKGGGVPTGKLYRSFRCNQVLNQ